MTEIFWLLYTKPLSSSQQKPPLTITVLYKVLCTLKQWFWLLHFQEFWHVSANKKHLYSMYTKCSNIFSYVVWLGCDSFFCLFTLSGFKSVWTSQRNHTIQRLDYTLQSTHRKTSQNSPTDYDHDARNTVSALKLTHTWISHKPNCTGEKKKKFNYASNSCRKNTDFCVKEREKAEYYFFC